MPGLYIIIPAYNEQETIRSVIEEWYLIIEKYSGGGYSKLVIIDDGSTDDTYSIMQAEAKKRPYLEVMSKKNGGHGDTVLFGYEYATKSGAEYIFQTDSDGQTSPEEFEKFWVKREIYDAIIGYRKNRKDGLSRIFVTKVLKIVIFFCFGVWVADANTPYRLMKAEVLKKYLENIPEHFNLPNVLLSVIYAQNPERLEFIPITFRKRQGGVNSLNLKKIARIGKQAVKDFWKIKGQVKRNEKR